MRYIIVPIEDAQIVFTQDELDHARKSVDGSEVIIDEPVLIRKRQAMGFVTLPADDGGFEWTYPVYEHDSEELNTLLNGSEWSNEHIIKNGKD